MRSKIIIGIIAILVLAISGGVVIYLIKTGKILKRQASITPTGLANQFGLTSSLKIGNATLNKEGFSIMLPNGWRETQAPLGAALLAYNAQEQITDPALKKINFRSYYSVSYDQMKSQTLKDYAATVKNSLSQLMPGVKFNTESSWTFGSNKGYKLDMDISDKGADFKVLMVLISGNQTDVWVISFNTTKDNWAGYQTLFDQIAASFKSD